MGKSTLAKLIVKEKGSSWRWLSFRGKRPDENSHILHKASLQFDELMRVDGLVLDDLDFETGELPAQVQSYFPVSNKNCRFVPPFDLEDVKDLAAIHGCPQGQILNSWAIIIFASTAGHPQLVHARIRRLEDHGWCNPQSADLIDQQSLDQVRRQARITLDGEILSKGAKKLAHMLSIFGSPFRRDHALCLAQSDPDIPNPGLAFDQLLGPWIEQLDDKYYRLSALLSGSAVQNWTGGVIRDLRRKAAEGLIESGDVTLLEAKEILFQGLLGELVDPVARIIYSLFKAPDTAWSAIAQEFDWLIFFAHDPQQRIFPSNPAVSLTVRHFQFRVAIIVDPKGCAPRVAKSWSWEIESFEQAELKELLRFIFLLETIIRWEMPLSQRQAIERICEARRLGLKLKGLFEQDTKNRFPVSAHLKQLTLLAVQRCSTLEDLQEFLSSIEEQGEDTRRELLAVFEEDEGWARFFLGKIWVRESELEPPDWFRCIGLFQRTAILALNSGSTTVAASAYEAIAVINDEYLEDPKAAFEILEEGANQIGEWLPILLNQQAKILYRKNKFEDALAIWERVLPTWRAGFSEAPTFACRSAEICAARLGNWEKAAKIARMGEEVSAKARFDVMAVGFRADFAFALWKQNNRAKSITELDSVLDRLEGLPDPKDDLPSYTLHKKVGHAIAWMDGEVRGSSTMFEPPPGFFSNNATDERIQEYPIAPSKITRLLLADIEYFIKSETRIFKKIEQQFSEDSPPTPRCVFEQIRIGHCLRQGRMDPLVHYFGSFLRANQEAQRLLQASTSMQYAALLDAIGATEEESVQGKEYVFLLLTTAILKLLAKDELGKAPLAKWKTDAAGLGIPQETIHPWFHLAERGREKSMAELYDILANPADKSRLLAASFIFTSEIANPTHFFYANCLLIEGLQSLPWNEEVSNEIETGVTSAWLRIASKQPFLLCAPRVSVPAIMAACDDPSLGFHKAAKIVLAAQLGTGVGLPSSILAILRRLAGS